jgi:hypothetical protein
MFDQKFTTILTFLFVMLSQTLLSQIVLQGTITDTALAPVQNALVELIDQTDTTRRFSDYSDEQGQYIIQIEGTKVDYVPAQKPGTFHLLQNYPNPFNPSTVIEFELDEPADIFIEIYNVLGQKIKTLSHGFHTNGIARVVWNSTDDAGQSVPAGVYIYSMNADGIRINKKMLLMDGQKMITLSQPMRHNSIDQYALAKVMSNEYMLRISGNDCYASPYLSNFFSR